MTSWPTAMPAVWVAGAVTAVWLLRRWSGHARDRLARHRCLGCGYDLRGSVDRCPECGRPAPRRLDADRLRRQPSPAERMSTGPLADPPDAVVHETADRGEAHLVAMQLDLRGVPVQVTDVPFPGQPFLVLFRVGVATTDVPRATAILRRFDPPSPA